MKVSIVGAGIAGLLCATRLREHDIEVVVLEEAPVVGGRLATATIGEAVFDVGAQFFTVRTGEFKVFVDGWLDAGIVREWCRGFGPEPDGFPRYVGTTGMASIAETLASRLDVQLDVTVDDVDELDGDAVVTTAPGDAYDEMLAILCVLDGPSAVPAPGGLQLIDDPTFGFVADNQLKGLSPVPAVTIHCRPGVEAAVADAARFTGDAGVVEAQTVRWRHGRARAISGPGCVVTEAPRLTVLAGDRLGGTPSRVEGAALSGLAAADAVLARLLG